MASSNRSRIPIYISVNLITKFLYQSGKYLARPTKVSWTDYARKQSSFNALVGAALLAVVLVGFHEPIINYISSTFSAHATITVPREKWQVLYEGGPSCDTKATCFASPEKDDLWQAKDTLGDDTYLGKARAMQGKRFWVGLKVDPEGVKQIRKLEATSLVIGHINAGFNLYVDGDLRLSGDGNDYLPIVLKFGRAELNRDRPLKIALEVNHNLGSVFPVAAGLPEATGFFSPGGERDFRNKWVFKMIIRPVLFAAVALLSAIAFIGLWLNVTGRSEFLTFGLFGACLCSIQVLAWGNIKYFSERSALYKTELLLRVFEGVLAGLLGLTYSRSKVEFQFGLTAIGIFLFLIMFRSSILPSDIFFADAFVGKMLVPFCFIFGGFTCFTQAIKGSQDGFKGGSNKRQLERIQRLNQFGSILLILGFVYFVDSYNLGPKGVAVWMRPVQFLLTAVIGAFLFRDFREFDLLQQTSHQSKFHDPTSSRQHIIQGFLLDVDMKGSSKLYDFSASLGLVKEIPTAWTEAAIQTISSAGGEILTTDGDAFRAFFEGSNQDILHTIFGALINLKQMTIEFESDNFKIEFRGAILGGGIQPTYKELNGKRYEDYNNAPGETCFKDASRYLKEEKKLNLPFTVIVMDTKILKDYVFSSAFTLVECNKYLVDDVGERDLTFIRIDPKINNKQTKKIAS